ncbi:MAG: hypothetical protein M3176_08175 [Chloroflexota bacterium]|nr:hypothetical protein [Chloroflexota bacterium]MDQ6906789.1 hypothetical protein [Chloroflexota bacterium]
MPLNSTFTATDQGVHTFQATLLSVGSGGGSAPAQTQVGQPGGGSPSSAPVPPGR